jgi:acetyl esterase/lipase
MSDQQRLSVNAMLLAERSGAARTLDELRAAYDAKGALVPIPDEMRFESRTEAGVPLEFGTGHAVEPGRSILYVHGGGGVVGSFESHRGMVARLGVGARANTIAVGYRLAPEHVFPAGLEDVIAAYRWAIGSGIAPSHLAVAADSVGASLVLAMLMQARDQGLPMPAACVLFSPMVDQTGTAASMEDKAAEDMVVTRDGRKASSGLYIGTADRADPRLSPLFGDFRDLPPLLVQVGTAEALLDDSVSLARRAMLANVDVRLEGWPRMQHVWHQFASLLDEGSEALDSAARFLGAHLGSDREISRADAAAVCAGRTELTPSQNQHQPGE